MRAGQRTVLACYDVMSLSRFAGIADYTDGVYQNCRDKPYDEAQRRQHDYLLDELGVRAGFRLLDVGCGTGTLLRRAQARGAHATGITIAPGQVEAARAAGLDVRLVDYVDLPRHFGADFDGIVANGSIEHFCQPEDALQGRQDGIYRRMFAIFHPLLDPRSPSRRLATTVIHFRGRPPSPRSVLRSPFLQCTNAAGFHFATLHRGYGGYYPSAGQLARCAASRFRLVAEQDATDDYRLTSEDWQRKLFAALRHGPLSRHLLGCFLRRPRHTFFLLASFVGAESWLWQFRGEPPPVMLLRQTWQAL